MYHIQKIKRLHIRELLFILLLSIMIGLVTAFKSSYAIIGVVSLLGIVSVFFNWKFAFKWALIGLLTIPFGTYQFFNLMIPVINIDVFTVVLYLILSIIVLTFLTKKKINFPKLGKSFYLFIGMLLTYVVIGYMKNQPYLIADSKIFLLYVLYFLSALTFNRTKDSLKLVLKILVISSFLLSVLVIFMYFFKSTIFYPLYAGTFYNNGPRIAVSNLSTYIISMPILISCLVFPVLDKRWNTLITLTLPLMIISALIAESRSLIAGLGFNVVITLFILLFLSKKRYAGNLVKLGFSMMILFLIIVFLMMSTKLGTSLNTNFERFNEVVQTGTSDSYETRVITNAYTLGLIKSNLLGHGMGSPMWLTSASGAQFLEGNFIDNGFLTILYKVGVPGLICFLLFYATNTFKFLRSYTRNKKSIKGKLALVTFWSVPAFLVNSMYFTSQLVMNFTVFSIMLILFAFFNTSEDEQSDETAR